MAEAGEPRTVSTLLHPAEASPRPPVTVNGATIERSAIAREAQYHPGASPGDSMRQATEALVVRELLLQEAWRAGIVADPQVDDKGRRETDEDALIRQLIEHEVATPIATDEEVARYYAANRKRFRSPDLFEASHILVAARRDDATGFAAARAKAEAIAADLASLPENLASAAKVFSDCPSRVEGGHLGQITKADVTAEFAAALDALAEGETTGHPIETRYGFHLIRLHRRIAGKELPLEAVAGQIAEYLTERSRRTATAQFIARLVSRAEITGVAIAGADAHRVY